MIGKTFVAVSCLVVVVLADEKYTSKYDNINVEEIMANDNTVIAYSKCLLDEGPCTAEGKELKSRIKDAMETGCEKCTDIQKEKTEYVIKHLVNKKPVIWEQLTTKYDPDRTYRQKYEELAKEHGIDKI